MLRSVPQAQALAQILTKDKSQPPLATHIRKLRLEGCYGFYLSKVFKASTNITHLYLSVNLPGTTQVTALVKGFRDIRPKHLILDDDLKHCNANRTVVNLFEGLIACIAEKAWSLVSCLSDKVLSALT